MRNHYLSIPKSIQLLNKKDEVKQLAKHCLLKPTNLKPGSFTNVHMDQIFNVDKLFLKDSVLVMNRHWEIDKGEYGYKALTVNSRYFDFYGIEPSNELNKLLLSESADRIIKIHYFLYHGEISYTFNHPEFAKIIYKAKELSDYYKKYGKKLIIHICKYQYRCIKDYIESHPEFKDIWESIHISIDEGVVFVKGSTYYYFTTGNVLYRGELYNVRNMEIKDYAAH